MTKACGLGPPPTVLMRPGVAPLPVAQERPGQKMVMENQLGLVNVAS